MSVRNLVSQIDYYDKKQKAGFETLGRRGADLYAYGRGQRASIGETVGNLKALGIQSVDAAADQAAGDVSGAYATGRKQMGRNLRRMGVDPNSGRAISANAESVRSEAASKAGAMTNARRGAENKNFANLMNINNIKSNLETRANGTVLQGIQAGQNATGEYGTMAGDAQALLSYQNEQANARQFANSQQARIDLRRSYGSGARSAPRKSDPYARTRAINARMQRVVDARRANGNFPHVNLRSSASSPQRYIGDVNSKFSNYA